MNVAAYVRVSTEEQAEKGNSIFEQQERLTAYCRAMGWEPPTFFVDDGFSAKNLKRPAIADLIKRVRKKEFQIVLATKLDRVCRNLLDLLQLVDVLEQYDCSFVSASESFDTSTAAGRMTLNLLGMFAQFERERISERVKDNMISLAKNTDKALTRPCFGYILIDGNFEIDEVEAEHVRFMFDQAEQGRGTRYIAKLLNEKGVKTKRGKLWDSVNVKRLMINETLTGSKVFNRRKNLKGKVQIRDANDWIVKDNSHPAIISKEQFDLVQKIFNSRKPTRTRSESETYLLTGIIYCKYCGGRMKGNTARQKHGTYHNYLCSKYVLGYGCQNHSVNRDRIEQLVIEQIKQLSQFSDVEIENVVGKSRSAQDEIQAIETALSKINKRMQKQIEAYENDLISMHDLKMARERIDQERQHLELTLDELKSKEVNAAQFRKTISSQLDDVSGTDRIKAKKSMPLLIDQIIVEAPNIEIIWRF